MDGQTLTRLAKAHATLIKQYTNVTQAEAFSLVGQIMQFVAGSDTGVGESIPVESSQSATPPAPRSTGAENAPGEGAVLAKPGEECYCTGCKSTIYEVVKEVRGRGMGVNAFLESFSPVGHSVRLTRETLDVIKDANGNTYIDCPVCKGSKTLKLIGKHPVTGKEGNVNPVTTVSVGEF